MYTDILFSYLHKRGPRFYYLLIEFEIFFTFSNERVTFYLGKTGQEC